MGIEVPYPQRVVRHMVADASLLPMAHGDVAPPARGAGPAPKAESQAPGGPLA